MKRSREEEIFRTKGETTPFTQSWLEKVKNKEITRPRFPRDYANILLEYGFIVVPLYGTKETKDLKNQGFKETLETMPEYLEPPQPFQGEVHYVKGPFGALGNPSSFHNPFVRDARMEAFNMILPVFQQVQSLLGNEGNLVRNIEEIVDRMRVLRPKATIGSESWHRDTTPKKYTGEDGKDIIYGGWINFDRAGTKSQRLSVFPKSHKQLPIVSMTESSKEGFTKASAAEIKLLNDMKQKILEETDGKGWFIEVPPGHMLIFQQEMVHEVLGGRSGLNVPSYRLFTGWRLTNSNKKFLSNVFTEKLNVPKLKSGQAIDMWPQANWRPAKDQKDAVAPWDNLETWSRSTFKPTFLEDRKIESGDFAGETKRVIPRRMYNMNDVSIKLQALNIVKTIKDNFGEDVEIPEIYTDIIHSSPVHWRERWSDDELTKYFFEVNNVFYPAYTVDEETILEPHEY